MRMPALPKVKSQSKCSSYMRALKDTLNKFKRKRSFIKVPERK